MFLPQGWHMVTVVEELERALQLARSGNLGNATAIGPLCLPGPPGPICPPSPVKPPGPPGPDWTPVKPRGPCSLFGPPNPAPSPGSHTSYSSCNPTLPERTPVLLLSSPSIHQTSLAEVKSEQVEVEEPRDHHVITKKGLHIRFRMIT